MLQFSEACERNKDAILAVLRSAFADRRAVLEIGSGTGQHAVYFAEALPHLAWYPTERPPALEDLSARVTQLGPATLRPAALLDVRQASWPHAQFDAAFTANTLHIMSWPEVVALFEGLATRLPQRAVVCLYGPFSYDGGHTSASNQRFDAMLRDRDPASGIRDQREVVSLALRNGMRLDGDHEMPANNRLLVFSLGS